jgi:electron transport complex protein RnfD
MLNSPYIKRLTPVSIVMLQVLLALVPAIGVMVYFYGIGVLVQIGLATVTAWIAEAAMLKARHYAIKPFLLDGSVTLTAWLLALSIPPLAPWWMVVLATAIAVVLAKHLYGGLGSNPFNPAMVGFAVLIISFPAQMSRFAAPWTLGQQGLLPMEEIQYIFTGVLPGGIGFDAIASATPLDAVKTTLSNHGDISAILHGVDFMQAFTTEWISLAYLLGGIALLLLRVIPWQIPVGMIAGVAVLAAGLHALNPAVYTPVEFHLLNGAVMLGAFFIATDPVTGPTTPRGRLIFAFFVGMLTYVIRVFGGFPDGIAFAVLLMNIAVPLIDQYTQPETFGARNRKT